MENLFQSIAKIFSFTALRYFILAGIPFILYYYIFTSKFSRSKIQKKMARNKDFFREITHSLQSTAVFTVIAFLIIHSPLKKYSFIYFNSNEYPIWWIPLSVLACLIIHDTYFYWIHRFMHNKKIYKHIHVIHHKSINPSPWTSYSFHFIEAIIEGLVLVPLVFLLPLHPIAILLFNVAAFMINVYGHLGYETAPKQFRNTFLFEIFNTSVHHNLHHSRFHGNYGLYFRFWDRVMKTENPDYVKEYDRIQKKRFDKTAEESSEETCQAFD